MDIPHSPFFPFDPGVGIYRAGWGVVPWEYSGWKPESMAAKTGCYLHAGLNPTLTYRIKGPDAVRLLSDLSVNSFAKFDVGAAKHVIMVSEEGFVQIHGMCLRLSEDEFMTYWLAPYLTYHVETGDYDVVGTDLTGQVFLFQLCGPRSLEVLQAVTGEDLSDIRFIRHRRSLIRTAAGDDRGADVNILRIGMGGSLAYEVHGAIEDAHAVYDAIHAAGRPFGLERLGWLTYNLNHTEAGFPQSTMHFPVAWDLDEGFTAWRAGQGRDANDDVMSEARLEGSLGPDPRLHYRTPIELGWGHVVKFDHDFIGRSALEAEVANPRRKPVTLVWNVEDILDVFASQFEPGEEYEAMDMPMSPCNKHAGGAIFADQVLKDGRLVGVSMHRVFSYYYRDMISLAVIDLDHGALGTEVHVLWGAPGTRQKQIRATVARYPYLDEGRNETIDFDAQRRSTG